jgi:hypothetical protein
MLRRLDVTTAKGIVGKRERERERERVCGLPRVHYQTFDQRESVPTSTSLDYEEALRSSSDGFAASPALDIRFERFTMVACELGVPCSPGLSLLAAS